VSVMREGVVENARSRTATVIVVVFPRSASSFRDVTKKFGNVRLRAPVNTHVRISERHIGRATAQADSPSERPFANQIYYPLL
jgi:hypothetical protein